MSERTMLSEETKASMARDMAVWRARQDSLKARLAEVFEDVEDREMRPLLEGVLWYGYKRADGTFRSAKAWSR